MSKLQSNDTVKAAVPIKAVASWRRLSLSDIPGLIRIAEQVHPDLPERDEVFAERIKLFPEGCLALIDNSNGELSGYIISHPTRHRQPPALDSLLEEIAPDADQFFIHDIAILPKCQGQGLANVGLAQVFSVAGRLATIGLVSVYSTRAFWGRFGFVEPEGVDEAMRLKLEQYGDDAVYLERVNK